MAIRKQKELPSGLSGDYWKIIDEKVDRLTWECTFKIALFKDQASAAAGHLPLGAVKIYRFTVDKALLDGDRTELGYQKIKEKAATLVSKDFRGKLVDPPVAFDPDLAGGEDA